MECIFCKIARKEIASEILYEDENFIAFLDINPRSTGMTLVMPKKHVKELKEDENLSKELFGLAIKISEAIKEALMPVAISIAYFPSQIEHLHLRIYPYFENEVPLIENKPKEVNQEELRRIAEAIRKVIPMEKPKEKAEEKKIEKVEEAKEKPKEEKEVKELEEKKEENKKEGMSRRKRDWLIA